MLILKTYSTNYSISPFVNYPHLTRGASWFIELTVHSHACGEYQLYIGYSDIYIFFHLNTHIEHIFYIEFPYIHICYLILTHVGNTQFHAFFFAQKGVHGMDVQKSIMGLLNCKYLGDVDSEISKTSSLRNIFERVS